MTIPIHVRYPARCDNQTAAKIIGCQPYQVSRLAAVGLLTYLNSDQRSAVKYCSTVALLRLTSDSKWQLHATTVLNGGDCSQLPSKQPVLTKKRVRGLVHEEVEVDTTVGSAQWMIDAMLASMSFDHSAGKFLAANIEDADVARILGFRKHDLPPLRRAKKLKCLNSDKPRARKKHSREYILGLVTNESWLAEATILINQHWKDKNSRKAK